jgi:hypothetical protein
VRFVLFTVATTALLFALVEGVSSFLLVVLFALYVASAYAVLRLGLPAGFAFLGALIVLFSFWLHFMSDLLYPDLPFALATTCFFLCHSRREVIPYRILAPVFGIAA